MMIGTPAPADFIDHHDHHFPSGSPDFSKHHGLYGVDASPEVTYDYHEHFHHDHDHDLPPPEDPTTTEAPEPVKKFTYYHIRRKLWYIPLGFAMYFSLYVISLILRGLGRRLVLFFKIYCYCVNIVQLFFTGPISRN